MRRAGIIGSFISVFLLLAHSVFASEFYKFEIIAKTGQAGLVSIQNGASINDNGDVAFTGTFDVGNGQKSGLFVGNGSSLTNISPTYSQISLRQFSPYVQINNFGNVIATNRVTGTPLLSFARVWDSNNPESYQDAGKACSGGTGCNQSYPYNTILSAPTINNSGAFAFSAMLYNNTYLVTNNNALPLATGTTLLRPMLADDGRVVVKHGQNPLDPILLYNNSLTSSEVIAGGSDWSELGRSPGISDDGQIVVFYGNLTSSGATKFTTTAGPGIFASIDTTNKGRVIQRIAAVSADISSFSVDTRVAVNTTQSTQRAVTIVYIAFDSSGNKGIYSSRLNFYGTSGANASPFNVNQPGEFAVTRPTLVVKKGESITGLGGTVQDVGIYDPLNSRDRGDIALWVQMTTGIQAAVRARYQQLVFIDFDPFAHCTGANQPIATQLLTAALPGVLPGWAPGNMQNVLAASGRGFNAVTIQDNIVDLVQSAFDKLLSTGAPGVNVKVTGRQGDVQPKDGPFVHVFVGDGPYGVAMCTNVYNPDCGCAGIASTIDLFNQLLVPDGTAVVDYGNKPVLVFVDNIFRVSSYQINYIPNPVGIFYSGTMAVPLNYTGTNEIKQIEVERAISSTIAHEVGHALGLYHLDDTLNSLLMNQLINPNELRYQRIFGNTIEALGHGLPGTENSGARLALSVGSDNDSPILTRDLPDKEVLKKEQRIAYSMAALAPAQSVFVVRAFIGLASLETDVLPELIDLGSGDLVTLLDRDLYVKSGDKVLLLASTNGSKIDIFSVDSTFNGDVGSIDLSSALLVLTDTRLRGALFDNTGQQLATSQINMYQLTPSGPVKISGPGPALVTVPDVVNQTQVDARAMITTAGLTLGMITTQNVDSVPAGYVISQNPTAGTQVVFGSSVNLLVSLGLESVLGDLNGDSKIDCADVAIIKACFGKKLGQAGFNPKADVNDDGIIDIRDLSFVSRKLQPGTRCP